MRTHAPNLGRDDNRVHYRGVIFDFNGVLCWDTDWQVESWQGIAKSLRGRELTAEEFEREVRGRGTADGLMHLVGHRLEDKARKELVLRRASRYRELCLMNPRRFVFSPGTHELLDQLVKRNIPHAIATSADASDVEFFIRHLGLDRWFDLANIVYDDGVRPGKPLPDIYLEASRRLGVEPHWCVAVEDSVPGLAAAQCAGIGYIVALGLPSTHERLMALPGVSLAIQSLRDFPRELLGFQIRRTESRDG